MRKHIIITWSMVPFTNNWGGCQRMYYLADSLVNAGDLVEIICAYEGIFDPSASYDFKIYAYDMKGNLAAKEALQKKRDQRDHKDMQKSVFIRIVSVIAKVANYFLNESSPKKGVKVYFWIIRNFKNIQNIVKNNDYDDVIISGPPHTLFFLLKRLKKIGVRIILDYRDPWNAWRQGYFFSKRKEKKFLIYADEVVCTNLNMKNSLVSDFKVNPEKVHVIGNGYSKKNWNGIEHEKEKNANFVISYIGSINLNNFASFRNCKNVIEAFVKFNSIYSDTILKFVGVNDFNRQLYEEYKKKNILIQGKVAVDESFRIMKESDVLMVMHTAKDLSGKYIISAKLYDYIAADKTVIGIGHYHDLHKKIIEKEHIGIFCENNADEIEEAFEKLYEKWKSGNLKVGCLSKEIYTREFQNKIYVELLNGEFNA